jgi:hypothetical protein
MTIDIVPTLLEGLGFDTRDHHFDGADLVLTRADTARVRMANSHADPELRPIADEALDVSVSVREARQSLRLDEPGRALWGIGPYDHLRGRPLSDLCEPVARRLRLSVRPPAPLPDAPPDRFIDAFDSGRVSGRDAPETEVPFIVTANGRIVASGTTWKPDKYAFYYALIEPRLLPDAHTPRDVLLLVDGQCWSGDMIR